MWCGCLGQGQGDQGLLVCPEGCRLPRWRSRCCYHPGPFLAPLLLANILFVRRFFGIVAFFLILIELLPGLGGALFWFPRDLLRDLRGCPRLCLLVVGVLHLRKVQPAGVAQCLGAVGATPPLWGHIGVAGRAAPLRRLPRLVLFL